MQKPVCVNARFLTQRTTGVQRYAIEISRELRKIDPTIRFYSPRDVVPKELAEELCAMPLGRRISHAWEQFDLPRYLRRHGRPLLLNLGNTAPVFYENKVSVVHDIAFVRCPKSFSTSFRFAYRILIPGIIKTSKLVATVSEFSKREICAYYRVPESHLAVVHNAASSQFRAAPEVDGENFVLAVSSISYQKNFISLVRAFRMLNRPGYKLRVVGGIGLGNANKELLREVSGDPSIEFLGPVSDAELKDLYRRARCFVFPSFYEGFGLPPLEAQACGCPVVVSNRASLPEIYDSSALYCDPSSPEDICEKVQIMVDDSELRRRLILDGLANVRRFEWRRSAKELLSHCEAVA